MHKRNVPRAVARLSIAGLAAAFLVTGCAPSPARQAPPDTRLVQRMLAEEPRPGPIRREYAGADGERLGYRGWRSPDATVALVQLHGMTGHGEWFDPVAQELQSAGIDVYSLDRRGSGVNRENHGFKSGDVADMNLLVGDVQSFIDAIRGDYRYVVLAGDGWGGKLAAAFALRWPDTVDGLVLVAPKLGHRVKTGLEANARLGIAGVLRPRQRFRVTVQPEDYTSNPEFQAFVRDDPLKLERVTAGFLLLSRDVDRYVEKHVENNRMPVLVVLGGQDTVIDNASAVAIVRRGAGAPVDVREYADKRHGLSFDAPRQLAEDIASWLEANKLRTVGTTR